MINYVSVFITSTYNTVLSRYRTNPAQWGLKKPQTSG